MSYTKEQIAEALEAAQTALQERGEFHIYRDGKVYTRAQCNEFARILHSLAADKAHEGGCERCKGSGRIRGVTLGPEYFDLKCKSCNGTGFQRGNPPQHKE